MKSWLIYRWIMHRYSAGKLPWYGIWMILSGIRRRNRPIALPKFWILILRYLHLREEEKQELWKWCIFWKRCWRSVMMESVSHPLRISEWKNCCRRWQRRVWRWFSSCLHLIVFPIAHSSELTVISADGVPERLWEKPWEPTVPLALSSGRITSLRL